MGKKSGQQKFQFTAIRVHKLNDSAALVFCLIKPDTPQCCSTPSARDPSPRASQMQRCTSGSCARARVSRVYIYIYLCCRMGRRDVRACLLFAKCSRAQNEAKRASDAGVEWIVVAYCALAPSLKSQYNNSLKWNGSEASGPGLDFRFAWFCGLFYLVMLICVELQQLLIWWVDQRCLHSCFGTFIR